VDVNEPEPGLVELVEPVSSGVADQPAPPNLRDLVSRAYPDAVPEMLQGETVEELLASLPAAQAAYQRVVEQNRQQPPLPIPPGGAVRSQARNVDGLSPALKIRMGIGSRGPVSG
jgi:hypothetical protein